MIANCYSLGGWVFGSGVRNVYTGSTQVSIQEQAFRSPRIANLDLHERDWSTSRTLSVPLVYVVFENDDEH